MNSLISTRIMASSVPKSSLASILERYVLPTPEDPKKRKEPIGFPGSLSPTLFRWMAVATSRTT